MTLSSFRFPPVPLLLATAVSFGCFSCGKRKPAPAPVVVAEALKRNHADEQPGAVYQSQAVSRIRWQPWSRETFENAKDARRLILAVVVLPQQGFNDVLEKIEKEPALVSAIDGNYVPVILDGEVVREMSLLSAPLCAEIRQRLDLPLFLWLTHELNPVAWTSIPSGKGDEISKIFLQSSEMVGRMWRDDPNYVLTNSHADNESRRSRLLAYLKALKASANPSGDAAGAARQLASLYDPFSRTIDESGGLFPSGVFDVMSTAAILPGLTEGVRERGREVMEDLLEDLLPSAMFDPLEGGVFSGRTEQTWALPNYSWTCSDQGRVASVLFRAHQVSGNRLALERAISLLRFAEMKFMTDEGLFVSGAVGRGSRQNWLWTTEEIEQALPPEDAKWWIAATGMTALGNLPSEIDPGREFFRRNTLALPVPLETTATKFGVSAEEFRERFEKSRLKLLEVRNSRIGASAKDTFPHAGSNFRMISAYSAAYAATGDESWRAKATALFKLSREKFQSGGRLQSFGQVGSAAMTEGRAILYALAVQAALDVSDITSDDAPLDWVTELCETAEKIFKKGDDVLEVSEEADLMDLPISDRRRIFDDTTTGVFALSEARLSPSGHPAADILRRLAAPLPEDAVKIPILHTDVITAALVKHHSKAVIRGQGLSGEMKTVLGRLPLQLVPQGSAKVSDGIPEGSVRVISADGSGKLISDPSALIKEVLGSDIPR